MVVLFTLWFILQWQFPSWLWILSGLVYVMSLRPKKKIKKQISFKTQVLPLSLLLAIIFGVDALGNPILPQSTSVWAVIGIFFGAIFIRLIVASPIIKKQISKNKNNDNNTNVTIQGDGIITNDDDDELKLHIKIKNKEKNKNSNFKISLETGFFANFIQKIALKGMQNAWKDPAFQDESGNPLFDIHEIYEKAKKNPTRGELLTIDNEKVTISISIK
tara:strand:+ start:1285 stop:1938 length:654 start_codon:yes stop_codon:yes gene_type:complete